MEIKKFKYEGSLPGTHWRLDLWLIYIYWSSDRCGFLRILGNWYGIHWKHKYNARTFSERNGFTKSFVVGKYRFKILNPTRS